MVTKALLQNDGGYDVALTPNSRAPVQSAAATSHNISIHRFGHIDKPNQANAAMMAPMSVEPTSSCPAERALVEPDCVASVIVLMTAGR